MTRDRGAGLDRARVEADVDAELAFHRAATVDELVAAGYSRAEAEAEAHRRFGAAAPYRDRLVALDVARDQAYRWRTSMDIISSSVRAVGRDIRRSPGFALGVVAMLALGLGVNAITFGLVDRLVLSEPPGLRSPSELRRVVVHRTNASGATIATTELGYLDYLDLRQSKLLAGAAGESASPLLFGSGESAERIFARFVTAGYFPLLGTTPAIGRFFTDDESAREGARVVVLGHAFWQRRFNGDASVLGQTLQIEDHRYTVIGVAPRHFTGSAVTRTDVFLPLEAASDEQVSGPWRTSRGFRWMGAVVRLAPGATDAAVSDELTELRRQAYAGERESESQSRVSLTPLNPVRGQTASGDIGMAALVGLVSMLVLIVAVANAANLFLARSLRRRAQLALRLALGGGKRRLIIEQAVEGAGLALIGAAVAVGIAAVGAPAVQRLLFPNVAWLDVAIDLRLLGLVAALAVAGGGFAAALPLWRVDRTDLAGALRTEGSRLSRRRSRGQSAMLLVQGALTVLLLVGAGLFVRSLNAAQAIDLGIEADRLMVVSLVRGESPAAPDFLDDVRARISRIPGVDLDTRVSGTLPFVSSWAVRLNIPGLPERPRVEDGGPYIAAVEPNYFATVGTSIVEGRAFTEADVDGAPRVAVVNRTMARLFWPGVSALGQCMRIGDDNAPCSTVVGIAENTRREGIVEGESLLYYIPIAQAAGNLRSGGRIVIRAADAGAQARIAEIVRREALALDPTLRYAAARPVDDLISPQLRAWRIGAALFSVFGVIALAVAAVGLYSIVAFEVEGRRREMGVRSALGATSTSIVGLVIGNGLRACGGGVILGLILAWLLAPVVTGFLYDVPARDPRVFAAVGLILAAAAILASSVPGLRAARTDPTQVLRAE
ncbi:MAG TPA: ABC transporter permease [Vicinamibacterales bacterium]|nr:ABC transporter permease [Vicinamibacterales bacterium]